MTSDSSASTPLPGDSFWVEEGLLLAGPYAGAPTKAEATAKLEAFLDLGITTFIDLTEEGESSPEHGELRRYDTLLYELARNRGIEARYARMPIPDLGIPEVWHMEAMLGLITSQMEQGHGVYVHCWGGVGRTGTVLGCLAVDRGVPRESVLEHLAKLRAGTQRVGRDSPETDGQRRYVLSWAGP
jgi:protein tyrosine/serine phosphatase